MEKVEKFLAKYSFLLILVLAIPAVWALFVPGFYGASDDLHIAWLQQMDAALRLGQFPPRFVPDLSFGFGYPLFNFVFPLPFYLGEIFHLIGFSFVDSVKAVFVLSIPLSGYFMYKFLKEYTSEILSLAGAVVYIFTPYRATDIFIRGAIGEIFAFVFPPLIALSLVKIVKTKSLRWIGILGFSTAGLLMSHNIMAYMFFPFLALLALTLIFTANSPRLLTFLKVFSGFVLGLLISIYFWLPAIVESALMKYDTVFNFKDHFPTIKQLIVPYFGYGASVAGPYDGMSFFLGIVNLLLVVVGIIFFLKKKSLILSWALGTFLAAVFMMNYRSSFIWDSVPYLPYFQFPWRFLSLTAFVTPIFIIALNKFKYAKYLGLAVILGVILLNFRFFRPADFLGRQDAYYLNRYIPVPVASEEYLKTGEEYLRLPKATQVRPDRTSSATDAMGTSFEANFKEETTFNYEKYFFPGWEARIDGKKVEVKASDPYGQIQFIIPTGRHRVEVAFKETPFRKTLDVISLLAVLAGATIILLPKRVYEK